MQLVIEPDGTVRCIYAEEIDLADWAAPLLVAHPTSSRTSMDAGGRSVPGRRPIEGPFEFVARPWWPSKLGWKATGSARGRAVNGLRIVLFPLFRGDRLMIATCDPRHWTSGDNDSAADEPSAPPALGRPGIPGQRPGDDGLIEVEKLTIVILYTEQPHSGHWPSGWPVIPAAVFPGGSVLAASENCRFLRTCRSSRFRPPGLSPRSASNELLVLGLQLDRELDRHARYPQRQVRKHLQLPKLWAAFRPADVANITGDGPELAAYANRTGRPPQRCLNICGATTLAWPAILWHGSATTGSKPWRCLPIWLDFPSGRCSGWENCRTISSAIRTQRSTTSMKAASGPQAKASIGLCLTKLPVGALP